MIDGSLKYKRNTKVFNKVHIQGQKKSESVSEDTQEQYLFN